MTGGTAGTAGAATRQRLRRARAFLREHPVEGVPVNAGRAEPDALASALIGGDLQALAGKLSGGCVLGTDAGGLTRAALNPVHGAAKVAGGEVTGIQIQ